MDFKTWQATYPEAAAAPGPVLSDLVDYGSDPNPKLVHKSEGWAQQQTRFGVAKQGAYAFRNNVGATPSKCKACGAKQTPVRYGLANDSTQMNSRIKSADLILAIPRQITPDMVGKTIAQFGSIECKKPGWEYSGAGREKAQLAWVTFIESIGGFARFGTGDVDLSLT